MSACGTTASRASGTAVHFGAHPTLVRVGWPSEVDINANRLCPAGAVLKACGERVAKPDFQVIAAGTPMIEWRDIRRIRASFPANAQTLYRLKSNSFPLWNWATYDLSCPKPECPPAIPAMTSHVFWTCPCARRHWEYLLDRWRQIGDLKDADLNVWVFGMDLPDIPRAAWDAIKQGIDPSLASSRAKDAVFPAARELWRFIVSTTLHAIWTERLRRMGDSSLPQEVHTARARTQFRRAITRFRGSTYPPGMRKDGHLFARVRSMNHPPCERCRSTALLVFCNLLFFDGESRGNPGSGGAGSVIVQLHPPTHAACEHGVSSAKTTNNVAKYWGLVHGLRQARASGYSPLHVIGDSALVLSQLRTHHPPRKPHLELLFQEARALADSIDVASWGHHYRNYNKMAHRMANIAMDTGASIQVQASYARDVVMEAAAFLDNDVNHWLEASQVEHYIIQDPAMIARNRIISRQDFAQRRSAVQGLVLPSI